MQEPLVSPRRRVAAISVAASILLLSACAPSTPRRYATTLGATNVTLYRGVKANPSGQINWTKDSFGVSGKPTPSLSLFDSMNGTTVDCWLSVTVVANGAVSPAATGDLNNIPQPGNSPNNWNPGPWNTVFDDNPPGHWSIMKPTIGGTSNADSSRFAAAVFQNLWQNGYAMVHNGSVQNCRG